MKKTEWIKSKVWKYVRQVLTNIVLIKKLKSIIAQPLMLFPERIVIPCPCACSRCPQIFVTLIIRLAFREVVVHVIFVRFLNLQLQAGRHLPSQSCGKTSSGKCQVSPMQATCLPCKCGNYNKPRKTSTWWLSSVLDVELALGRPPWLLLRLAASSEWPLPCCNRERTDCEVGHRPYSFCFQH